MLRPTLLASVAFSGATTGASARAEATRYLAFCYIGILGFGQAFYRHDCDG